jgi:hypothetical protein
MERDKKLLSLFLDYCTGIDPDCAGEFREKIDDFLKMEKPPIKLTPIVLSRYGFKKDEKGKMQMNFGMYSIELVPIPDCYYAFFAEKARLEWVSLEGKMKPKKEKWVLLRKINYLHELENLVYAINGDELKYKNDK